MSLTEQEINRYSRHISLKEIGQEGQCLLKEASVLVIGAGGLGCPTLQYLAAAGVGTIGIVDSDCVEESNLQRQIIFHTEHIGKNKATVAAAQLKKLNPFININAYPKRLNSNNALTLFENYDIIIDGSDNFSTRYLVNDAAVLSNKPIVYGAVHRFEGQVSVFNYQDGPSYRCLFPQFPFKNNIQNCEQIGVLGVLPGIIGNYMANEVIKIILRTGQVLTGKLMLINTLTHSNSILKVERIEDEINKVILSGLVSEEAIEKCFSNNIIDNISTKEVRKLLSKGKQLQFLDVRERHETPKVVELRGFSIPMSELSIRSSELDHEKPIIVYCQSGLRSQKAIQYLQEKCGFKNLLNLEGGLNTWINEELKQELI